MEDVLSVASYIYKRYKEQFSAPMTEMKLHKLLYFTQREAIIQTGQPMFEEPFLAWRYGPIVMKVRQAFSSMDSLSGLSEVAIQTYKSVFDMVFNTLADKDAWSLSRLTHAEYSWQHAREGLAPDANCDRVITMDDIRKDADRIRLHRVLVSARK